MKSALLVLLFVAAAFATTEYVIEDGVYVLNDENFGRAMNEFEYALVMFYAPWCQHCAALAPEYAKAAQKVAETHPNIKLCKLDATNEVEVTKNFPMNSFPTLKFFLKGSSTPIEYKAGRTAEIIYDWVLKKTGPFSTEVKTVEEVEKQIADNQVLGLFLGNLGSEALTAFIATAGQFDDVGFAHSTDDAVKQKYGVEGETLILFKKFDEGKNVFTGPFNATNITDFLNNHRFPIIEPFDTRAAGRIFAEGKDALFLVTKNDAAGAKAEAAFVAASQNLKGKLLVSTAKWEDELGKKLSGYIGVTEESLPAVRICQPEPAMRKWYFDKEITPENLVAFVDDYVYGNLSQYRSEEIPAEPFEDNIRVIVAKQWEEIVLNEEKDAIVLLYGPDCPTCKEVFKVFSEVAKKLKDVEGVVVGKMDLSKNEVDRLLTINRFPTIKFFSRRKKHKPVDYTAAKTEAAILNFLKNKSQANFDGVKIPLLVDDEL